MLSELLREVGPWLDRYGYLAVAVLVLLDDLGLPAPGETSLILAGVSAAQGRLNIVLVGVVALAAAITGDNIGYLIGRGARPLVHRYGKYVLLTPARLERAERFVDRRGAPLILVARFVDGLRQLNGIAAGGARYPWRRFVVLNAIGATLWTGAWTALSYGLGDQTIAWERTLGHNEWYVLGGAVLVVAAVVAVRRFARPARGSRAGMNARDDEERQAERVAVPDEDLTADMMEGFGAALSGDTDSRRTPGPDVEDDLEDRPKS